MQMSYSIVNSNDPLEAQGSVKTGARLPGTFFRPTSEEYVSPENAAEKYLETLGSKTSVVTVRSKLNQFARFFHYAYYKQCDWHLMRYDNVLSFIEHLKEKSRDGSLQTSTINAYLCAVKGVAQTAWNLNQISDHDLMRIKNIGQLRGCRKMAGRALTKEESREFLACCEGNTDQAIRDRAILLLLLGCGLRRAEIAGIRIKDVFLEEARIRLIGKGNKERDVFLNTVVAEAVAQWVLVRKRVISDWNKRYPWKKGNAGDGSDGYLFGKWTRHFGYLIVDRPLNPWSVAEIVRKYKDEAKDKVAGLGDITTHDLRRTFATRLLDKGVDIATVKNLMGHSNISTTALYDRRGEAAMRKAAGEVEL